jgi:hypothetical protein
MAINWQGIQNKIDNFLRAGAADGNQSRTPDETAEFIATEYYNEIITARSYYRKEISFSIVFYYN